ncbi:MAG: GGDEF domain-containing protein [Clostridia bacterium]|nr:GGDEF domain-containing protein [Clostridia bacterium]MDR3644513.1 GGDEF domain-containing protein [Clostridia bacterium]
MKLKDLFSPDIVAGEQEAFQKTVLADNLRRGRLFALLVIGAESLLAAVDLATGLMRVSGRFHFSLYFFAYMFMIIINLLFLLYLKHPSAKRAWSEFALTAYVAFMLGWGSLISLMDQRLYGQLTVFMVNMICCSVVYYLDMRRLLATYCPAVLILLIGLPFFQKSGDILVGHYVNLLIFLVISGFCSRILYLNYCSDFNNRTLLNRANLRLQQLSFFDELTALPNRRSFNDYIDSNIGRFTAGATLVSVIMMDIDSFKQFNDTFGHNEGDKVLVETARQISAASHSPGDFAARLGGEEFIFMASDTNESQIKEIAEKIRRSIGSLKIPHPLAGGCLSLSFGTCTRRIRCEEDLRQCVELADKALYTAKACGKNCVRTYRAEAGTV